MPKACFSGKRGARMEDKCMHMDRPVFVFGSDLSGRHDRGAALEAVRNRGAVVGRHSGAQGNSYAIPTQDEDLRPLPLERIEAGVGAFLAFARTHPWQLFDVTLIGCALSSYSPGEIAPMFEGAPHNVTLPRAFAEALAA
jgi:hypothetical protein